ncbi:ABC transporter substrate-binding protein [Microbacterium yannicii]|uniref:ABC transporter substrate-binding protein n=1 Tax=Microbacterium yannicii TaxID=671622 RepID=UPI00030B4448|nr:extracellular solute-binding protein [Microbacterium yannicii]
MTKKLAATAAILAAAALVLTGCGGATGDDRPAASSTPVEDPELQALIEAAQEEGTLTLYGIPDERVLRAVAEDFTAKYGVDVTVLRLVSADLSQRFAAEADAGAVQADNILLTYSPFYAEAFDNDWLTPVTEADIPDFDAYPADYVEEDGTPIVSMVPTQLVYNSEALDEAPDSWEIYADPEFEGELLFAEPATSPANLAFWSLMIDEYGEEFLSDIAANNPTWMNSAVNTTQGVAAGEGSLAHPGVYAIVETLKQEGAPVEAALLGPTTGPEIGLGISADAPHPNAARLFAHYLLSEEGNTFLAEESGGSSPYGTNLVEGWVRPEPVPEDRAQLINELFGF